MPATSQPPTRPRLPKTQPSGDGLFRLPATVLFRAGTHTDHHNRRATFDLNYLRAVADNATRLRTDPEFRLHPPAVMGHEAVQSRLAELLASDAVFQKHFADQKPTEGGGPGRTDEPAAGWVENVRVEGDCLVADIEKIPPSIATLIDSDQLRFPSVEFRESFRRPDGTPIGPALWRLALLGGSPPAAKNVPPLGESAFADAPADVRIFADGGTVAATASPLRAAVVAVVKAAMPNLTDAFLEGQSDDQLAQLAESAAGGGGAASDASSTAGDTAPPVDQMKQEMLDAGYLTAEQIAAMSDDEIKSAYATWKGTVKMSDSLKGGVPPVLRQFADSLEQRFKAREADLDKKAAAIRQAAATALKAQEDQAAEARKFADQQRFDRIDATLKRAVAENREAPSALDDSNPKVPSLRQKLRLLPHTPDPTLAFADGNGQTVQRSLLDVELERIATQPVRKFGDTLVQTRTDADEPNTPAFFDRIRKQAVAEYERRHAAPEIPVQQRLGMLPPRHLR